MKTTVFKNAIGINSRRSNVYFLKGFSLKWALLWIFLTAAAWKLNWEDGHRHLTSDQLFTEDYSLYNQQKNSAMWLHIFSWRMQWRIPKTDLRVWNRQFQASAPRKRDAWESVSLLSERKSLRLTTSGAGKYKTVSMATEVDWGPKRWRTDRNRIALVVWNRVRVCVCDGRRCLCHCYCRIWKK